MNYAKELVKNEQESLYLSASNFTKKDVSSFYLFSLAYNSCYNYDLSFACIVYYYSTYEFFRTIYLNARTQRLLWFVLKSNFTVCQKYSHRWLIKKKKIIFLRCQTKENIETHVCFSQICQLRLKRLRWFCRFRLAKVPMIPTATRSE